MVQWCSLVFETNLSQPLTTKKPWLKPERVGIYVGGKSETVGFLSSVVRFLWISPPSAVRDPKLLGRPALPFAAGSAARSARNRRRGEGHGWDGGGGQRPEEDQGLGFRSKAHMPSGRGQKNTFFWLVEFKGNPPKNKEDRAPLGNWERIPSKSLRKTSRIHGLDIGVSCFVVGILIAILIVILIVILIMILIMTTITMITIAVIKQKRMVWLCHGHTRGCAMGILKGRSIRTSG